MNNCLSFRENHRQRLSTSLWSFLKPISPRGSLKNKSQNVLRSLTLKREVTSPALIKAVNFNVCCCLFVNESVGWMKFNLCDNVKHEMTLIDVYSPGKLNDLIWTIKFSVCRGMLDVQLKINLNVMMQLFNRLLEITYSGWT